MRRKLLIILIAIACIFCLAFALTACDEDVHDGPSIGDVGGNTGGTSGGDDQTPDDGDGHTHAMGGWIMIIKPTCTEEGTIARQCEKCDYTETDTIRAIGHREVVDPAVPSTCNFYGRTEGSHCGICGEVFVEQKTLPRLLHTVVIDKAVDPTCTTYGLTEGKHCDVCGEIIVEQKTIRMLGHITVIDKASDPTCTEDGFTEGKHCERCGETIVAQQKIEKLGHSFGTDNYCDECGEDGLYYIPISGGYEVSRGSIDRSLVETVTISETYENLPVTRISLNAFYGCQNLKSVIIPDTVTEIGNSSFVKCEKLESINLPESVKLINNYAFMECSSLTEIIIGDNVETIGRHVFRYCESLKTVKLGSSLQSIDQSAFIYCSSLAEITIPASVTEMGSNVFAYCTALKSVIFENAEGWTCKYNEDEVSLFASVLSDSAKAAEYLTDTYWKYAWHSTGEHRHIYGDDNLCDDCGHDVLIYELNADRKGYTVYGDRSLENAKKIIVAREHLGLPVTAVGNNAFTYPTVGLKYSPESVILPDTVTKIGDEAFLQCLELKEINLSHVEIIGEAAFLQCENLMEIDLSHVKIIGDWAFSGCDNLTRVTFSDCLEVIGDYAFVYCMISNLIIPASVKEIGYRAFDITALQSVIFEDVDGWTCVDSLGNIIAQFPASALPDPAQNAEYLSNTYTGYYWIKTDEVFPEPHDHYFGEWSVMEHASCTEDGLQERYCDYCDERETEIIPATGHRFGDDNLCNDCGYDALIYKYNDGWTGYVVSAPDFLRETAVTIYIADTYSGDLVLAIGPQAFADFKLLETVIIPASVNTIYKQAFSHCDSLAHIDLPENLKLIGEQAFYDSGLVEVTIPASTQEIEYSAFIGCRRLETVTIGGGNIKFGADLFANCDTLTTVNIEEGLTSIGAAMFYSPSLKEIVIPASVTSIGSRAFTRYIENVTFKNTEGWIAYRDYGNIIKFTAEQLSDPANAAELVHTYYTYTWWNFNGGMPEIPNHEHVCGDDNICDECGFDGLIYELNAEETGYIVTGNLKMREAVNIIIADYYKGLPVTEIGPYAFYDYEYLEKISIPDTVTIIGRMAFCWDSNLKSLVMPDSLIYIAEFAFSGCTGLTELILNDNLETIGNGAFMRCEQLKNITMPDNVKIIGEAAFMYCYALTDVDLGNVTEIGSCAFQACLSLKEIVIPESVTFIGERAFRYSSLERVIFEDAEGWNTYTLTDPATLVKEYTAEELSDPEENAKLFNDIDLNYRYDWRKERN